MTAVRFAADGYAFLATLSGHVCLVMAMIAECAEWDILTVC